MVILFLQLVKLHYIYFSGAQQDKLKYNILMWNTFKCICVIFADIWTLKTGNQNKELSITQVHHGPFQPRMYIVMPSTTAPLGHICL